MIDKKKIQILLFLLGFSYKLETLRNNFFNWRAGDIYIKYSQRKFSKILKWLKMEDGKYLVIKRVYGEKVNNEYYYIRYIEVKNKEIVGERAVSFSADKMEIIDKNNALSISI